MPDRVLWPDYITEREKALAALREEASERFATASTPEKRRTAYRLLMAAQNAAALSVPQLDDGNVRLCDLRALLDELLGAAFILAGGAGVTLRVSLPQAPVFAEIQPDLYILGVVNLLCYAVPRVKGETACCFEERNGYAVLGFRHGATSPAGDFYTRAARHIAALHHGKAAISLPERLRPATGPTSGPACFSMMEIPICPQAKYSDASPFHPPTAAEYITDRFSPVAVGLWGLLPGYFTAREKNFKAKKRFLQ